ncbi:MAG: hypothetical protein HEQ23_05920 [Tepidisphaera sp.]
MTTPAEQRLAIIEAELRQASGLEDPFAMGFTGGGAATTETVAVVLKYLATSMDNREGWLLVMILQNAACRFDGGVLCDYFDRHEHNRWTSGETIRRSKAKVPCEWFERALTNQSFGEGRQMLCEGIAKKCPKPFARRVLLAVLDQLPGHAPTGLGTCGTPDDIPRLSELATTVPKAWQRRECEKAIRKICRRHGLPPPTEPPASKR